MDSGEHLDLTKAAGDESLHEPTSHEIYRRILVRRPDSATAWALYGVACHHAGDYAAAVQKLEHAVGLQPCHAHIHVLLARSLMELGRWQDASIHYTAAMALDAENQPLRDEWERQLVRREILHRLLGILEDRVVGPGFLRVIGQEMVDELRGHEPVSDDATRQREAEIDMIKREIGAISAAVRAGQYNSYMKQQLTELKAKEERLNRELAAIGINAGRDPSSVRLYQNRVDGFVAAVKSGTVAGDAMEIFRDIVNHVAFGEAPARLTPGSTGNAAALQS